MGSSLPQAANATMAISMNAPIKTLRDPVNKDRCLIRLYKPFPPIILAAIGLAQSKTNALSGQIYAEHHSIFDVIVMSFPMGFRWQRGQVVAFKTPFRPSGIARADARLQRAITNRISRYGSISKMNGDTGAPTV